MTEAVWELKEIKCPLIVYRSEHLLKQLCWQAVMVSFLLFTGNPARAQQIIEGTIRDSTGTAIVNANIYVHSINDQHIISYAYTDRLGRYGLSISDPGAYLLNASALAYKTAQMRIHVPKISNSAVIVMDITLNPSPFELSEVVVNTAVPVLVKKDTISINADRFVDGSEQVIEDVLRKLPGIEVTGDGTIKVQGKSIEKVMVEGDDLFESRYRLLTKNLHASVVQNIEIIEHFAENPLLKQVEETDNVALNIKLKAEIKSSFFGNLSISHGNMGYYEDKANIISYLKKVHYYVLGNINNVGADVTGDMYQLLYPDVFSGTTYIGDGENAANHIDIGGHSPPIDRDRYHFNNAELVSFNTIYSPAPHLKMKGLWFFSADETDLFSGSTTYYDIPPAAFSNDEAYGLRKSTRALSAKWNAVFDPDTLSRTEYTGHWNKGNFINHSNGSFNTDHVTEKVERRSQYHDHRLTLTRKMGNHGVVQVTGRHIQDNQPSDYLSNSFLLNDLFPKESLVDTLAQLSGNKLNFTGVEVAYLKRSTHSEARLDVGYVWRLNHFKNRIIYGRGAEVLEGDDLLLGGNFDQKIQDIYGRYKHRYGLGKVSLRFDIEAHQYLSETSYDSMIERQKLFSVSPKLGLGWEIDRSNKFLATYTFSATPIPFDQILPAYVLTGRQKLIRGLGDFELFNGSLYLLNYSLGNWSEGLFLNFSFIYGREHKYSGTHEIIHPKYTLTTPLILKNKNFYSFNITVDAFLEPFSTNCKLKANINGQNYQNKINTSGLRSISSISQQYGIELRSAFTAFFNFHVGSDWTFQKVSGFGDRVNMSMNSFLDLQFRMTPACQINMRNELFYFGELPGDMNYLFTDLYAQLDVIPQKLQLQVRCRNLWNTRNYANYTINDSGSYMVSYDLLPRSMLLGITYRF